MTPRHPSLRRLAPLALLALAAPALAAGNALAAGSARAKANAPATDPGGGRSAAQETRRAEERRASLTERVHFLGASLTAGFGLKPEYGVPLALDDLLAAVLRQPIGVRKNHGDVWMFRDPIEKGREQVEAALEAGPTLVVAADFLFWYGYGFVPNEASRVERLERGLAELDRLPCALVVGDLPDMRDATDAPSFLGDVPLLSPGQVPAPATLAEMNARIARWCEERERAVLLPIAAFHDRLHSGEALTLGRTRIPPERFEAMLQIDRLHPTVEGGLAVALAIAERLTALDGGPAPREIEWDLARARARLDEQHAEELRRAAERERRREERRRRREERERAKEGKDSKGGGLLAPRAPAREAGGVPCARRAA